MAYCKSSLASSIFSHFTRGALIVLITCLLPCTTSYVNPKKDGKWFIEELQQAIKESETRLMILDFFADWCGPCKRVAPELDKICEECEDVLFIKLNVDELESAAETYAIAAMPTFIAFKGGEKIDEVVGANLEKLREMIEKYK